MNDIYQIDGRLSGFREASRLAAFDLHVICGGSPESFRMYEEEYYLDERARILAWMPRGEIRGFIIYAASAFFYSDTDGEVMDIWVEAASRKTGVGRRLAVEALSQLRGRVGMEVSGKNAASLCFLQSLCATHHWKIEEEAHMGAGETVWKVIITK